MGDACKNERTWCKQRAKKRQSTFVKPDVMLITKNVMVPVVLPPPSGKLFPAKSVTAKKPRIVKARKYNATASFLDATIDAPNTQRDNLEEPPFEVRTPVLKKRMVREESSPTPILSRNPTRLERFYQLRRLLQKKEAPALPFPNPVVTTKASFLISGKNVLPIKNLSPPSPVTSTNNSLKLTKSTEQRVTIRSSTKFLDDRPFALNIAKSKASYFNKTDINKSDDLDALSAQRIIKSMTSCKGPKPCSLDKSIKGNNISEPPLCITSRSREKSAYNAIERLKSSRKFSMTYSSSKEIFPLSGMLSASTLSYSHMNNLTTKSQMSSLHVKDENDIDTTNSLYLADNESEIKVLDYNSILSITKDNSCTSVDIKCSSTKESSKQCTTIHSATYLTMDTTETLNRPKYTSSDAENLECKIKYSWQDVTSWVPPSQKNKITADIEENKNQRQSDKMDLSCKIKYSWQIVGTSTQTSQTLIQSLLSENDCNYGVYSEVMPYDFKQTEQKVRCSIKYSWEIIGISTQTSLVNDDFDQDYWKGIIITPSKRYCERKINFWQDNAEERIKNYGSNGLYKIKYIILNNEATQTFAEKENQTDFTDCRATYSWQNLIRKHLQPKGYLQSNVRRENVSANKCALEDTVTIKSKGKENCNINEKKEENSETELVISIEGNNLKQVFKNDSVNNITTCNDNLRDATKNTEVEGLCFQKKSLLTEMKVPEENAVCELFKNNVNITNDTIVKNATSELALRQSGYSSVEIEETDSLKENGSIEAKTMVEDIFEELIERNIQFQENINIMKDDSSNTFPKILTTAITIDESIPKKYITREQRETENSSCSNKNNIHKLKNNWQTKVKNIEARELQELLNVETNYEERIAKNNTILQRTMPTIKNFKLCNNYDGVHSKLANKIEKVTSESRLIVEPKQSENLTVVSSTNIKLETVEIFPSTFHALGNYIIKDVRSVDIQGLGDSLTEKNIEIASKSKAELRDMSVERNNFQETLNEKDSLVNISPIPDDYLRLDFNHLQFDAKLKDTEVLTFINDVDIRSDSIPSFETIKLPVSHDTFPYQDPDSFANSTFTLKEIKFSSMLSYPATLDTTYSEANLCANDRCLDAALIPKRYIVQFPSKNEDNVCSFLAECDYQVANDWNGTTMDTNQMIGVPTKLCQLDEDDPRKDLRLVKVNSTEPLRPRTQSEIDENSDHGDRRIRKDELLTRLTSALTRLKQYEQSTDANWCLDRSFLNIKEDSFVKDAKLPVHVEDNIKGIMQSAHDYISKLEEQLKDLDSADDQIVMSAERSYKDIDETYQTLMDDICQEINRKRDLMRLETKVYKNEGLAPLKACRQEVNAQIRSTQNLIVLTEAMLKYPQTFNRDGLDRIVAASSNMGRIPAVPLLEELPYMTFSRSSKHSKEEILTKISELGCVLRMGPAQLMDMEERPAGLFVKWCIADPEYATEEQTFIIQKATGEVLDPTSNSFETVYEGSETNCFIRDLPIDCPITLRVGIQASDTAWSTHRIAKTTISAYSWNLDNKKYMITNNGKIAAKITDGISTLLSRGPQFSADHIIEFKFLEVSQEGKDDEGIALVFEPTGYDDTLKRNGALLVTPRGKIFMDGEEKLMQLPKMRFGTRIIFTALRKGEGTLRVNIECADKAVTYDWTVQTPLHFAARFTEYNKWNLMVK